jgi:Cytochrome C'
MMDRTRRLRLACVAVSAVLLYGCNPRVEQSQGGQSAIPQAPAVPPAVSINALMVGMVDHAGHVIWNAGAEGRAPKTDKDWEEVEHHAIQLAGASTLITMGGTGPADAGWAQLPDWRRYSKEMSDEAVAVLTAARSKNQDGLMKAGDQLVTTCEGCHKQFKPDLPTEGLVHPH